MSKLAKALTAAAGNAGESLYVEDVFSTYLYDGNGTTQTITNGIDLAGEGGLVWCKPRTIGNPHYLGDTERGINKFLESNATNAEGTSSTTGGNTGDVNAYNANGFSVGSTGRVNQAGQSFASWTFRKAEKFFDVVTYSSDTTSGARTISHNLGSTPAFIIVKGLNFSDAWYVYHISTGVNKYLELNLTGAGHASTNFWGVTDSTFTVDGFLNNNGSTGKDYVVYLFASDAGGFGDDGDENIIKCGSITTNWAALEVDVGFEPQFVIAKVADRTDPFRIFDNMRGVTTGGNDAMLRTDASYYEDQGGANDYIDFTPTGFVAKGELVYPSKLIYIAIRRPMKTPESGTEVFGTVAGAVGDPNFLTSFPVDMGLWRTTAGDSWKLSSRLAGVGELNTNATTAEITNNFAEFDYMNGWYSGNEYSPYMSWMFKRATGFFDVVAYTGNNVEPRAIAHGLGVVPEMIIIKNRSGAYDWVVYHSGNTANPATEYLHLNANYATLDDDAMWKDTAPTASVFTTGNALQNNNGSHTYIAYLFATLAGVSKVGSYTGTGADLNVDCGFSAGARFILIKRTDSTGDWYVWDSLRGIVAGNDPYLLLNSTAAEVTSTDYIDPLSSGFTVTSSAPAGLNNSGGSYIFLAMA
jgi:hypothetical protein